MKAAKTIASDKNCTPEPSSEPRAGHQSVHDSRAPATSAHADLIANSVRLVQQRAMKDLTNDSPRMAAQRRQLDGCFCAGKTPAAGDRLPAQLKAGIESLSGVSMDDVKVHYNSSKPAQLQSLAYAQGTDIHLAPGQEKHLPHEAWHVVQQRQGRVKPTLQMKTHPVNDEPRLEREADVMGARAAAAGKPAHAVQTKPHIAHQGTISGNDAICVQRKVDIGGATLTENRRFAVGNGAVLYAQPGYAPAPIGHFLKSGGPTLPTLDAAKGGDKGMKKFDKYAPKDKFTPKKWGDHAGPNDCLFYAGALANNALQWGNNEADEKTYHWNPMREKIGGAEFEQDRTASNGQDPAIAVGDTYFMRYHDHAKKPATRCDHHGATVVAIDGNDKVSAEADASQRISAPKFKIYGPAGNGSFYETYQSYYRDTDNMAPILTVLTAYPADSGSASGAAATAAAATPAAAVAAPTAAAAAYSGAGPADEMNLLAMDSSAGAMLMGSAAATANAASSSGPAAYMPTARYGGGMGSMLDPGEERRRSYMTDLRTDRGTSSRRRSRSRSRSSERAYRRDRADGGAAAAAATSSRVHRTDSRSRSRSPAGRRDSDDDSGGSGSAGRGGRGGSGSAGRGGRGRGGGSAMTRGGGRGGR